MPHGARRTRKTAGQANNPAAAPKFLLKEHYYTVLSCFSKPVGALLRQSLCLLSEFPV